MVKFAVPELLRLPLEVDQVLRLHVLQLQRVVHAAGGRQGAERLRQRRRRRLRRLLGRLRRPAGF